MQAILEYILAAVVYVVTETVHAVLSLAHSVIDLCVRAKAKHPGADRRPLRTSTATAVLIAVVGLGIAVALGLVFEEMQRGRAEQTQQQIDRKADELIVQFKKAPEKLPKPGRLVDRDAWDRPLELFVDNLPGGTLIVVRSCGRDGRSGTIDDLLAMKESAPGAIDLGKAVAQRGIDLVKARLGQLRKKK